MRDVELVERTRNANNYHWLATRMAEDYGDLPQAETLARRAAELHPGAAVYHLGLSRILQQRCNTEGSVEAARNAVAAEPANFESHFQLAAALLDLGDLRQASEAFDKSIDAAPKYLRIHVTNRWDKIRGKAI
jgi:tetratricopeptide (TPR) repeat protein